MRDDNPSTPGPQESHDFQAGTERESGPGGSIHATPSEITVAQLMAEIRDELSLCQSLRSACPAPPLSEDKPEAQRRKAAALKKARKRTRTATPPVLRGARPLVDWEQIKASLDLAEKYGSSMGTKLPEMTRFRGLRRMLAQFVGKVVMALGRVITGWQRQYNLTVLDAQRDLAAGLFQLEQAVSQRFDDLANRRFQALEKAVAEVKNNQLAHERRTNLLLEEARRRLPGPFTPEQLQNLAAENRHALDALTASFQDQLRGRREDVQDRLRAYLPRLHAAGLGTPDRPILDLASGRGEWLELLRAEGLAARGVEDNGVLVCQCRQRGLEAAEGDALEELRGLPDASLGAVTGFHLLQRLPFPKLVKLLDEAVRVLQPGGLVIFETPNPENVLVGACTFRADPGQHQPLYPATVQFMAEHRGLVQVEIVRLYPPDSTGRALEGFPEEHPLASRINRVIEVLNAHFTVAADFALIGRKA
jgi:SAM-dependent methyltransferase